MSFWNRCSLYNLIFYLLRKLHTIFDNNYTNLLSHQSCKRAPFSSHPQDLLTVFIQVLRAGALGRPRRIGWGGRLERGLGWGTHVNPWLIHVNVWQKPLQYCKVISFQLIRKKILISSCDLGKKKDLLTVFIEDILICMRGYLIVILMPISLIICDIQHIFMFL